MATSEILVFAEGPGANIEAQAAYAADPLRTSGNIPGVAKSALNNKALLQSSLMASALAKFVADNQANNIVDTATVANLVSWLGDALRGALGVTPPQFDADLSLATTGFVQRALGNTRGLTVGNVNRALTVADVGSVVLVSPGVTLTLPLANSVLGGSVIHFRTSAGGADRTIAASGSDTVSLGNGSGSAAGMKDGDTLSLMSSGGGSWINIGGVAGRGNNAQFGALLAADGYQKLPSGLIIQWATYSSFTPNNTTTKTRPIAFPGFLFAESMTPVGGTAVAIGPNGSNATQVQVRCEAMVPTSIFVISIGV